MRRTASCACGQLRATIEGEPERVLACHCRECQRRTGSVLGVSAYFAKARVTVEGLSSSFVRTTEQGLTFDTRFCATCGSSVLWTSSALPDHVAVAVGAFADPSFPAPTLTAWTADKHPWVVMPEGCRSFAGSAFAST
jgi:hypothetical protein